MSTRAAQAKAPPVRGTSVRTSGAMVLAQRVISSPGRPLDVSTRGLMEAHFGRDLSGVRIHTDEQAAESAQLLDANAYTIGSHIAFGSNQYVSGSNRTQHLMAHELTHVAQSARGCVATPVERLRVGEMDAPTEREAERISESISLEPYAVKSLGFAISPGAGEPVLRRQPTARGRRQPAAQTQSAEEQQRQAAAADEEKEAQAWDLARVHFRPELLIKFQEIGRAAAVDARNLINNTFEPFEKEITSPDQTFLNIFLGGAGNVPQGELGGFLGGAASAGLQAAVQYMLNTDSVADVKERARSVPEDIILQSMNSNSPLYYDFERGAMDDLYQSFSDWWNTHTSLHDDAGQIRVEALLLEEQARQEYGANSERGQRVRAALRAQMEPRFAAIREELQDLQDAYRRRRELGIATGVGTAIGAVAGGIVGGLMGGGAGVAIGALVGGLGLGALTLGATRLSQAFRPTPKELRERQRQRQQTPGGENP